MAGGPGGRGAALTAKLAAAGVEPDAAVIVVHVSAGNPFRRWPEPAFIRLVTGAGRRGARIDGWCSARDRRIARPPIASPPRPGRCSAPTRRSRIVDCGELNLAELRAVIARSRLFVGGDTGPLHVAATTSTPVVGIYGPTLDARSAPWRDRRISHGGRVRGRPPVPAVRSARVRARRFSMPDDLAAGRGDRGGRTPAGPERSVITPSAAGPVRGSSASPTCCCWPLPARRSSPSSSPSSCWRSSRCCG